MVTSVAWSRDGRFVVAGDEKGTVIAWNPATERELWRAKYANSAGRVRALAISPDGATVAVAVRFSERKSPERVVLLNAKDGKEIRHLIRDGLVPITALAWSSDGNVLVAGSGAPRRSARREGKARGRGGGVGAQAVTGADQ